MPAQFTSTLAAHRIIAWLVENGDAQTAVGIDVWVPERALEAEVGRREGVVVWEGHAAFEVAAVVGRVGVEDDEGDTPFVDVFVDEGDVGPGFFGELLELVHEDFLRHLVGRWEVVVRLWCGVGYLGGVVTAVPFSGGVCIAVVC